MATKRGRREGRHAGRLVREEVGGRGAFGARERKRRRDLAVPEGGKEGRGELPDTMPMLTSTAVQVEEPMKSQVTSVDEVWKSWVAII